MVALDPRNAPGRPGVSMIVRTAGVGLSYCSRTWGTLRPTRASDRRDEQMIDSEWRAVEDGVMEDLARVLMVTGRIRLERHSQEFILVAEALRDGDGSAREVRVALRRGGGAFVGPGHSFPAAGTIFDSVAVKLTSSATSLQAVGPGDRSRVSQAAAQLLERAARRIDSES